MCEAAAAVPRTDYTLIAAQLADGRVVGCGTLLVRSVPSRAGEIAYVVHPDLWGRGLGSEIASLLLRFAFEELGMHRVYATCDPRNIGSGRVLQKIGMTHEGMMRGTHLIRDGWRDSDLYAILEDEWRALARTRA
jgi:RimJ/RimL family protein N-acetyltransferase